MVYNEKFKKFLYYYWVAKYIVPYCKTKSSNKKKFQQIIVHCTLIFSSRACITTIDFDLASKDFSNFYTLIFNTTCIFKPKLNMVSMLLELTTQKIGVYL
jgi:hypothetical protein